MLSLVLLLVGITAADTQNNFVAVEWTSYSDGTISLVPITTNTTVLEQPIVGSRFPAGQDLPPPAAEVPDNTYTPPAAPQKPAKKPPYVPPYKGKFKGLGKYGCIKQGYLDAGEGDVSNKFIAMVVVRAKDRNDHFLMTKNNAEKQTLRESIYSSSALGSCKGNSYRFNPQEAAQADQWLSGERINVSRSQYKGIFQIDSYKVDQVVHNYDTTPTRIQRNWDYWGAGTPAHSCAKPLPYKKRIRLCQMIARACKVEEVGCNRGNTEIITRDGGGDNGNDNGGNGPGGNGPGGPGGDGPGGPGGDGPGGPGGDGPGGSGGGETGPGSNADSHGGDNGGGHGDGPK